MLTKIEIGVKEFRVNLIEISRTMRYTSGLFEPNRMFPNRPLPMNHLIYESFQNADNS